MKDQEKVEYQLNQFEKSFQKWLNVQPVYKNRESLNPEHFCESKKSERFVYGQEAHDIEIEAAWFHIDQSNFDWVIDGVAAAVDHWCEEHCDEVDRKTYFDELVKVFYCRWFFYFCKRNIERDLKTVPDREDQHKDIPSLSCFILMGNYVLWIYCEYSF